MSKNYFYIFNAGCIRRGLDSILIKRYFEANGWELVNSPRRAKIIVIATCGVVQANEKASLKAISKSVKLSVPNSKIIITGCLPKINPDAIKDIGNFCFIPTRELDLFDNLIMPKIPFQEIEKINHKQDNFPIIDYLIARSFCRRSHVYKFLFNKFGMNNNFIRLSLYGVHYLSKLNKFPFFSRFRSIVPYCNIKISEGCLEKCTFCATRFATGSLKSKSPDDILKNFHIGLNGGYRVFQLIAEDTGAYGIDIGLNLPFLLKEIFGIKKEFKISIIDYNPRWLIEQKEDILSIFVKYQSKIEELFISIQSGSDFILKRMNRKYRSSELKSILKEINKKAPSIKLRTSVMVGFPGEEEEDFHCTVNFIKDVDFFEVTVNRYEDRPKIPSSRFKEKVPYNIIQKRANFLEKMGCFILS